MAARRANKTISERTAEQAIELPPGTPAWISEEMVEHTLRVWQPRYRTPLTVEDAVSILVSTGRLLHVLSLDGQSAE